MSVDGADAPLPLLNINVGVLGHVDAGKTSLVRALSTSLSTAALDKHPQAQARGITIDLGFSAFTAPAPPAVRAAPGGAETVQFTLVDCPGHAGLIRTVIGGASIMDMMLLVVDAVKGVQTQTAECLVVAEITTETLIVVLNKVDLLLPEASRPALIAKASERIRKVLAATRFASAPIIALSAAPGGAGKMGAAAPLGESALLSDGSKRQGEGVAPLVSALLDATRPRVRWDSSGGAGGMLPPPLLFAVDHCFAIKGKGTILTGTVLAGSLAVGDALELPSLRLERRVKSIQMFHRPVNAISAGDRAGVCVTALDASVVERTLACAPGAVPPLLAAIALVRRIRFFKGTMPSEARVHVTVGHSTLMARAVFFGAVELAERGIAAEARAASDVAAAAAVSGGSGGGEVQGVGVCAPSAGGGAGARGGGDASAPPVATHVMGAARGVPDVGWVWGKEWVWQAELLGGRGGGGKGAGGAPEAGGAPPTPSTTASSNPAVFVWQWAALIFDGPPVIAPIGSLVVGSRLDADESGTACRLAFHGRLVAPLPLPAPKSDDHALKQLRLYKLKTREGVVDRIESSSEVSGGVTSVIGRGVFKKEADLTAFVGLRLTTRAGGHVGVLDSAFGKSGKFKATFERMGGVGGGAGAALPVPPIRVGDGLVLAYKKALFAGKGGAPLTQ